MQSHRKIQCVGATTQVAKPRIAARIFRGFALVGAAEV